MLVRQLVRLSLFFFVIVFASPSLLLSQDVASLAGVVTDSSGAVIPGVKITLTNASTGAIYQTTTNSVGTYTILRVPPGPGYKVTFSLDGFNTVVVSGVYLNVGNTRTQNAELTIGTVSQAVEVSASGQNVTLDTTNATVGNNFQVELVNDLPVQIRDNPAALFRLQPGVTNDGSVTGARVDQNNVTLDGLDVNDMATGRAFSVMGNAPVDSVQEFRGITAGPSASDGQGGGGQFAMVTKSGTNVFHGSLFEYHRDTTMEANEWFNNNAGVKRAPLIRNQFGGNLGGPLMKNRAFFFFEYNGRRDNQGAQVLRYVPLNSFRNGTVSYIKNKDASGTTCTASSRQNTTPQCIGALSSAQVAALDPQGIGFDSALLTFINKRYPQANDLTSGDGINTGGYRFNAPVHLTENDYVARIDYKLNDAFSFFVRGSAVSQTQGDAVNEDVFDVAAPIQFPGDPLTKKITNASWAYVIGSTWVISPTKTNQIIYGETRSRLGFPVAYNPTGNTQFLFGGNGTGGTILANPYMSAINAQNRVIPIPIVRDDFTWLKGTHSFQFGGLFKFIKTFSNTLLNYDQPTLGLGGNMNTLNSSLRPSDIRTAGTTASKTYDSAFALALGRYGNISSTYNYDSKGTVQPQGTGSIRHYRYYESELYFGDTWRVTPNLALSYGIRYQWYSVPYETNGLESIQNFTFDEYLNKRIAQSSAGLSGIASLPLNTYTLGGKANHAPGLYDPSYKNFAPRVSFAYNPGFDNKSVVNGGVGIVFDHTVVNAVQYQQDQHSYLFQGDANTAYGTVGNPQASLRNDPRFSSLSSTPAPPTAPTITRPYQPFVDSNGTPYGLANGQAFNTSIDPKLRNPYSILYNIGFQHEFSGGFILKTSYVGRLGRRLLGQADANQVIDFPDRVSSQMLSKAFANLTQQLRDGVDTTAVTAQPWFENVVAPGVGKANGYSSNTAFLADNLTTLVSNGDFADFVQALAGADLIQPNIGMASQYSENTYYTNKGFSTYHGMLVTLHKNRSHGLQFDLNYTWSHSIDNVSIIANQSAAAGYGFICDALRPRECRGNSDFDVTNYLSGNFLYSLPFGRGRAFAANSSRWLDEVIGGWDISGIPSWHTGIAFSSNSSAFVAGYSNNAPGIFNGDRAAISSRVHKTSSGTVTLFDDPAKARAAFTGPVGFTIGSRNNLRGPQYFNMDLGVGKTFPMITDKLNLKFRADAFNSFNHPNFSLPSTTNSDITAGTFGQISSTVKNDGYGARVLQLALRLEF